MNSLDGNRSLCTTGKPCSSSPGTDSSPGSPSVGKSKKSSTLPVVLGITIPAFFLIWVAAGAGTNGNSNGLQNFGEQVGNATTDTVVQQTFGSPSPLLDNSGDTSN
ncbi:Malectin-like carbohydrate-binding domain-containing protein [Artemisia annua]|uniref:Malectin-like carbohydrate-binding domain-containing protein n=1 Tax=Artemisia annua TaxID=35608 RepID=A0A2U1LVU5_ARTAN|nr:Malectin-like carbohydrate-binding domain-containing protein [Artemisia annua]